jgi:hypothetical protein
MVGDRPIKQKEPMYSSWTQAPVFDQEIALAEMTPQQDFLLGVIICPSFRMP